MKPIRSYVLRQGRMTPGQRAAFETLWSVYGVAAGDTPWDLDALFGRRAPRIVEIGFGMGDTLAALAQAHPQHDYLGIEVHRPGVGRLLNLLEAQRLDNVRIVCADAVQVLERNIPDAALDALLLYFPDPWPKRRHAKRRLVQPEFAALVARKLKPGGQWCLATDWEDYARQMLEVLSAAPDFSNLAGPGCYTPRPAQRPRTKFEARGERRGHQVWDLLFRRSGGVMDAQVL